MYVSDKKMIELLSDVLSNNGNGINDLLEKDQSYSFALTKVIDFHYLEGIIYNSSSVKINGEVVNTFQKCGDLFLTDLGKKFLRDHSESM